jgi:hypothetical protein
MRHNWFHRKGEIKKSKTVMDSKLFAAFRMENIQEDWEIVWRMEGLFALADQLGLRLAQARAGVGANN